jgi:hypothetical protein
MKKLLICSRIINSTNLVRDLDTDYVNHWRILMTFNLPSLTKVSGIALLIAVLITGMVLVAGCTGQSSTPATTTTPAAVATTTITVMENAGVPVVGTSALAVAPAATNQTGNATATPVANATVKAAPAGNVTASNVTNTTPAK